MIIQITQKHIEAIKYATRRIHVANKRRAVTPTQKELKYINALNDFLTSNLGQISLFTKKDIG